MQSNEPPMTLQVQNKPRWNVSPAGGTVLDHVCCYLVPKQICHITHTVTCHRKRKAKLSGREPIFSADYATTRNPTLAFVHFLLLHLCMFVAFADPAEVQSCAARRQALAAKHVLRLRIAMHLSRANTV